MRLKSFYAKTVTEAMQMVRDMLGEDAIIVATREEKGGKAVCVTAAIEPGFENGAYRDDYDDSPNFEIGEEEHRQAGSGWLQYDGEDEEYAVTEEITEAMLKHGVPEDVLDHIISCATVIGLEQPSVALVAAIEHLYSFTPLPRKAAAKKPFILVGAPGAGKTLAVAKLAARGVMDGMKVAVITTDTVRAGGIEQLGAFTKLLQIDLKKAKTAQVLRETLGEMQGRYDQIYIDTQGINPFNRDDVRQAALMLDAADMESILVMPGGMDAEESGEIGRAFASLQVHRLMPTRIDMARRLGGILSAATHGGMSFTDAGNTPKVADGLYGITPQSLSRLLMPASYRGEGSSGGSAQRPNPARKSAPTPQENRKSIKQ